MTDNLKELKISFKDSSLNEFHIHDEVDASILAQHAIAIKIALRDTPSSDLQVLNQVLFSKSYEKSVIKFTQLFPSICEPIIFDLGAYSGVSCIYFKCKFPEAKICCLEPDQKNYQLLGTNVEINTLQEVSYVHAAVWNKNTYVLPNDENWNGEECSSTFKESNKTGIPAFDIPTLMASQDLGVIDFLKLSIEGTEKILFGDFACAKKFMTKVRFIAIDLHSELYSKEDAQSMFDYFNFEVSLTNEVSFAWNKSLL